MKLGKGELIGYDGNKHRKGCKVHAAVTAESLPLSIAVGPGDEHDSKRFIEVLGRIRVKRKIGRPINRPKELYADSAYDSKKIREYLRCRGIKANIPLNPRNRHKPKRGRPYRFYEIAYKHVRSAVERFFAWLKSFRRITIRYERLTSTFLAFVYVACIIMYLRFLQ